MTIKVHLSSVGNGYDSIDPTYELDGISSVVLRDGTATHLLSYFIHDSYDSACSQQVDWIGLQMVKHLNVKTIDYMKV